MFGLITKAVLGLFGNSILKPILDHLDKKQDVALERDKAIVAAEIQANAQRAAMATEFKPLVYLTALPFVLHSGAVMLDSTFRMGWRIPAAPEPFASWEGQIILSFFVLSPVASIAKGVLARLSR